MNVFDDLFRNLKNLTVYLTDVVCKINSSVNTITGLGNETLHTTPTQTDSNMKKIPTGKVTSNETSTNLTNLNEKITTINLKMKRAETKMNEANMEKMIRKHANKIEKLTEELNTLKKEKKLFENPKILKQIDDVIKLEKENQQKGKKNDLRVKLLNKKIYGRKIGLGYD